MHAKCMLFNDIVGDVRNDIYVTLFEGEFNRGSKTADKNVEVTMLVCNKKGEVIPVSCSFVLQNRLTLKVPIATVAQW